MAQVLDILINHIEAPRFQEEADSAKAETPGEGGDEEKPEDTPEGKPKANQEPATSPAQAEE